jgi:sugar/nucleoside kinase (ribokinase family)
MGARQCIIKLGREGALLAGQDGVQTLPAFNVPVMDTTSCGDAFCAGYVAALAQGWSTVESCRFAAATAALVAQGLGTLGALRSFNDTTEAMARMKPREAA